MKIVINECWGGFSLSEKGLDLYEKKTNLTGIMCPYHRDIKRTDKFLIEVIEELGKDASGKYANLVVKEIPDNSYYIIDEYDGNERIYYSKSPIEII